MNININKNITKEIILKFKKEKLSRYLYRKGDLIVLFFKKEGRIYKIYEDSLIFLLFKKKYITIKSIEETKNISLKKIKLDEKSKLKIVKGKLYSLDNVHFNYEKLIKEKNIDFTPIVGDYLLELEEKGKIIRKYRKSKSYSIEEWEVLKNEINTKNKLLKGLSIVSDENDVLLLKAQDGWGYIKYNPKSKTIETYFEAQNSDNNISHYYVSGIVSNIFNILRPTFVKQKIEKNKIYLGLLGLFFFIGLIVFNFTIVFDSNDIGNAFIALGKTWDTPWPYLFIMDYIINTFTWMVINIMVQIGFGSKPNLKSIGRYFVTANIRSLVYSVTGMHMLSMAVWLYLVRRNTKQRTASLIGNMGSITLITTSMTFIVGLAFTTYGSFYITTLDWDLVREVVGEEGFVLFNQFTIIAMGLAGLIFSSIGSLSFAFVTYVKFIQNLVFKFFIFISTLHPKFGDYFQRTEQMDIRIQQLRVRGRKRIRNKKFVTRVSLTWIIFFVSEMFASIYPLNMFRPEGSPTNMDIWNLTSIEMLVKNSKEAIWWPGGVGMIDSMFANSYLAYIGTNYRSYFENTLEFLEYSKTAANNSAIIERFFNFYLPMFFRTSVFGSAIVFFAKLKSKEKSQVKNE